MQRWLQRFCSDDLKIKHVSLEWKRQGSPWCGRGDISHSHPANWQQFFFREEEGGSQRHHLYSLSEVLGQYQYRTVLFILDKLGRIINQANVITAKGIINCSTIMQGVMQHRWVWRRLQDWVGCYSGRTPIQPRSRPSDFHLFGSLKAQMCRREFRSWLHVSRSGANELLVVQMCLHCVEGMIKGNHPRLHILSIFH